MTISILTRDAETGDFGGAAATGSLCVGGWVLRGDANVGMSASQGYSPSTLWGEGVLREMRNGTSARDAVDAITAPDSGRGYRQLSAIDSSGGCGGFTGMENTPALGLRIHENTVVAGNMLASEAVLDAALAGFLDAEGDLAEKLLKALEAAAQCGGDMRGLRSSALLIVSRSAAPLDARIDFSVDPLSQLRDLVSRCTTPPYSDWVKVVPTLIEPEKA